MTKTCANIFRKAYILNTDYNTLLIKKPFALKTHLTYQWTIHE